MGTKIINSVELESSNDYEKNDKMNKMKNIYCIKCNKFRKFKNPEISSIFYKTLVISNFCDKCDRIN